MSPTKAAPFWGANKAELTRAKVELLYLPAMVMMFVATLTLATKLLPPGASFLSSSELLDSWKLNKTSETLMNERLVPPETLPRRAELGNGLSAPSHYFLMLSYGEQ